MNDKKAEPSATSSERVVRLDDEEDPSLGKFLKGARERRAVSREKVVQETRIPDHYLRMLENNDYSLISDQLYLLPFLRRYAIFLQLDPEETAMRFVREVQRAENNPSLVRMDEPLEMDRHKGRSWVGVAIVVTALIVVIAAAYFVESHGHAGANIPTTSAVSSAPKAPLAPTGTVRTEADLPPASSSASPAKPAPDASTHSIEKDNQPSAPQKVPSP